MKTAQKPVARLVSAIGNYESDTFSATNITLTEAHQMAAEMIDNLARKVEEGDGVDGVMLTEYLDEVRSKQ